jgi:hypothetical protein
VACIWCIIQKILQSKNVVLINLKRTSGALTLKGLIGPKIHNIQSNSLNEIFNRKQLNHITQILRQNSGKILNQHFEKRTPDNTLILLSDYNKLYSSLQQFRIKEDMHE